MKKELDTAFDTSLYTGPKSEVVKTWIDMFTEGTLTPAYLREWFSPKIPEFYTVDKSGPWQSSSIGLFRRFKSSGQLSSLTALLEEFIYSGEKDRVNEFLEIAGQASSQCGKGFKHGEPSYNCRECSTDHTCVMCVECFLKSQHRFHKYRMATSTGGGYCDCGDTEAWKSSPFCETHRSGPEAGSAPPFPSDMHRRSKLVFSFVLQFSHEIINRFYCADLRVDNMCSNDGSEEQYLLLMYNDEIHTFDQVIDILVHVVQCTQKDGLNLASRINKEGRAVIAASDFETCLQVKSRIERISSTGSSRFLEVHILPFQVVAHQCFALDSLLAWTQTLLKINQGFRSGLIEVLEDCSPNTVSLLDEILVHDPKLWKSAKTRWNELLCSGFLPNTGSKKILASHYLINYPKIMHNYLHDEEDHTYSIAGLSVQLFTVPSIAQELICRYGAMESIINLIINVSTNDRNANGKLVFKRVFSRSFERACFLLYDVRYLLSSPPTSTWPEQLRVGFCRGMSSFLDFLGFIEGMDAHKRQLGSHIEFESEWETAFNLHLKCFPVIDHSLEWCTSNEQVLVEVFKIAMMKLKEAQIDQQGEEISINILGSTFKGTKFDTSKNAVTFHLPLTRYWAALYSMLIPREHLAKAAGELPIVDLIEPVMRVRAMIAQFRAGMWRKNGHSLISQVFFYHDTKFRAKTLDMDIISLQIGASLIDSNAFLTNLAYKFGLLDFIQPDEGTASTLELPETDNNQMLALIDEFLYLMIVLISERFHVGIGNVTPSDCIKNELIHLLAIGPMSHSELTKALGHQREHEPQLETVIKELTAFKLARETTSKGQYELKNPYHSNFNVFFYHFTKESSFNAEQIKKALHKKDKGLECCPPPNLPPFLKQFSKVINLLNCDIMLHLIKLVFDLWLKETQLGTDGLLHKALFLFGLALREEEKSQRAFTFTARARELMNMMVDIYCSGRLTDHKDLMKWVLQKYGSLTKDESAEFFMFDYDEKQKHEILQHDAKSRAEAARAKIMANMKMMQEQFSQNLKKESGTETSLSEGSNINGEAMTCILCQGEEWTGMENKTMVYAAFVQLSTVHMRNREPVTVEDLAELLLTSKMGPSPFISTCGHVMHAQCWEAWRLDVTKSIATRTSHGRPLSHNPAKNEFLCPLCESISNIAMPILPTDVLEYAAIKRESQSDPRSVLSFSQWLVIILKLVDLPEIPKRECNATKSDRIVENNSTQDQRSSLAALQKKESPATQTPAEGRRPFTLTVSEVGYNLDFGDKWILNIKRLDDASAYGVEPHIMDVTTEKLNWVHAMGSEIFKVATNNQKPHGTIHWDCTVVWKTLSYTIHSLEINLRHSNAECISNGDHHSVRLTEREEACLEHLIGIGYVLSINKKPNCSRLGSNQCALKLLKMVIKNDQDSKCMLEWDCFGVLVGLLIVIPNLVSTQNIEHLPSLEKFLLRLMLISRMAQILMTLDLGEHGMGSSEWSSGTACLAFLVGLLRHECIIFDTENVWEEVKHRVQPFLRCCVFFFHYRQPKRERNSEQMIPLADDTFECYTERLELPKSCKELLDDHLTISLFMTWGQHPKVRDFYSGTASSCEFDRSSQIKQLPYIKEIGMNRINTLVKLPHDYSELLNKVRDFSCSESDIDDSQNPTMCLICGKILCSLSYCCQTWLHQQKVGACTFHAHECGGGVGIFLRIRECQLIILAGVGRGCFKTAPYFDEHHEPDEGLRRGNKLLLCEESYKQLELSWRNHSLYDMVTRSIEMRGTGVGRWLFF